MRTEILEYGIKKYGTPLYVFNLDRLRERIGELRKIATDEIGLCYAMKANSFLIRHLGNEINRIEICSFGEYQICRELGIEPEQMLISGVLKKKQDIEVILEACGGRSCYTVESLTQFYGFVRWCEQNQKEISVYLRLTSGNQFGMDEKTIEDILDSRHMCPLLKIKGIHYFSGTQKKKASKIQKELEYLDQFLIKMEEKTGIKLEELEYGPGIMASYFEDQTDHSRQDLKETADAIANMGWQGKVTLEMGRAFAASCGYYLTKALDVKHTNEKNYCIVDGGIHQLNYDGQIRGMFHPKFRMCPEGEGTGVEQWSVCGALCTGNDVLMEKVPIKDLKAGQVFIFENAGAYCMTEGMSLFLSHDLPQITLYSEEDGWELVRKPFSTYRLNMQNMANIENMENMENTMNE